MKIFLQNLIFHPEKCQKRTFWCIFLLCIFSSALLLLKHQMYRCKSTSSHAWTVILIKPLFIRASYITSPAHPAKTQKNPTSFHEEVILAAIEADAIISLHKLRKVLHFAEVNVFLLIDHLSTTANKPRIKLPYIFLSLLLSDKY